MDSQLQATVHVRTQERLLSHLNCAFQWEINRNKAYKQARKRLVIGERHREEAEIQVHTWPPNLARCPP